MFDTFWNAMRGNRTKESVITVVKDPMTFYEAVTYVSMSIILILMDEISPTKTIIEDSRHLGYLKCTLHFWKLRPFLQLGL